MKILRVICSPRGTASESYRLSQSLIRHLIEHHRGSNFVITERGVAGLPHVDGEYAAAMSKRRDPASEPAPGGSLTLAEQLVREVEGADCLVIATPMHNLSVPSALKAWLDHVIQSDRTFRITAAGKIGLLRDRPVFIAIASGGVFSNDNPQQPDFLTPYLRAALATIGLHNLTFFSVEGTGQPSTLPATRDAAELALKVHFSKPLAVAV